VPTRVDQPADERVERSRPNHPDQESRDLAIVVLGHPAKRFLGADRSESPDLIPEDCAWPLLSKLTKRVSQSRLTGSAMPIAVDHVLAVLLPIRAALFRFGREEAPGGAGGGGRTHTSLSLTDFECPTPGAGLSGTIGYNWPPLATMAESDGGRLCQ